MPRQSQVGSSQMTSSQRPSSSQRASSSQMPSQSQARGLDDLDPVEAEKKVNDLVQFMLVMDQKKFPIKKKDINKQVLKESSKMFQAFMQQASDRLSQVFGFKVVELQDKLKGSFILVNNIATVEDQPHIQLSEEVEAKMGLLTLILSMVFMNGNIMLEEDMWHALKKVGVRQDEKHHTFGNVRSLIMEEFVRQGYLEVIPQPNTDPLVKDISWGQRAKHEYPKKNALNFVSQIYGTQPQVWLHPWQQVLDEEAAEGAPAT